MLHSWPNTSDTKSIMKKKSDLEKYTKDIGTKPKRLIRHDIKQAGAELCQAQQSLSYQPAGS